MLRRRLLLFFCVCMMAIHVAIIIKLQHQETLAEASRRPENQEFGRLDGERRLRDAHLLRGRELAKRSIEVGVCKTGGNDYADHLRRGELAQLGDGAPKVITTAGEKLLLFENQEQRSAAHGILARLTEGPAEHTHMIVKQRARRRRQQRRRPPRCCSAARSLTRALSLSRARAPRPQIVAGQLLAHTRATPVASAHQHMVCGEGGRSGFELQRVHGYTTARGSNRCALASVGASLLFKVAAHTSYTRVVLVGIRE